MEIEGRRRREKEEDKKKVKSRKATDKGTKCLAKDEKTRKRFPFSSPWKRKLLVHRHQGSFLLDEILMLWEVE